MKRALILTAIVSVGLVGCFDDGTRLSLFDGYSTQGSRRQEVAATTFRVSIPDHDRGPLPRRRGWRVVEFMVPDDAVAELPLELSEAAVTCRDYAASVSELEARHGYLRVVEARHDGLFVEYACHCDGTTVTGSGLFEVAGAARDGVWAYAPETPPSALDKLLDTAGYAAAGVF